MAKEILHLTFAPVGRQPHVERNASHLKQRVRARARTACIRQSGVNLSLPQSAVKFGRLSARLLQEPERKDCP